MKNEVIFTIMHYSRSRSSFNCLTARFRLASDRLPSGRRRRERPGIHRRIQCMGNNFQRCPVSKVRDPTRSGFHEREEGSSENWRL